MAWKAPFPLGGSAAATCDDPGRLNATQRAVQVIAGRASIHAMLNILAILLFDTWLLGSLQGRAPGSGAVLFGLIVANAALKFFLTRRTLHHVRAAEALAAEENEILYVRNAHGARRATAICAVVSAVVLAVGARLTW